MCCIKFRAYRIFLEAPPHRQTCCSNARPKNSDAVPIKFSEGCDEAKCGSRDARSMCAGRPRGVLRPRFRGRLGRGAGRHRPQRLRQDLAAAADRGPAGAGGRIDRPGRRRGRTDPAGTGPLSRPSRCAEAGAERAGKSVVLAGFSRRRRRRHRRNASSAVGLAHATHLPAAYLSAGQRRRLSIGRLLAVRRPVWLLDEPTSALDAAGQELFAGVMRDHLASGGIIVAATHAPLGIEARELRMGARHDRPRRADSTRHQDRAARRRRRADRRAVFPHGHGADAVRARARSGAA